MTDAQTSPCRPLCAPWVHPFLGNLPSRVVMTAMTRSKAGPGHVATPQMAAYYARRAAAGVGLILTESTAVSALADGFPDAPRLETADQAASWRQVTDAVHDAGARIFSQLLHCGRISHPDYTDGTQPVSSTGVAASGVNRRNGKSYPTPRVLSTGEIDDIIQQFLRAAAAALESGFDGIELHLAHGYLADQFLDGRINDRTDRYGGAVENRCRFALELVEAAIRECGAPHVMVRVSPSRWMGGLYDWPDLEPMLDYLIPSLDATGLRQLDISCARAEYHETSGRVVRMIRPLWPHFLMAGASLQPAQAQAELDSGLLEMVTYGRFLIANPDLVDRFVNGRPLEPYDVTMLETLE